MFAPEYASAVGLLQHLNSEELNQLLEDDEKLNNVVSDLQQVKNAALEKEMLVASNKSLAEYNLSLKPDLEQHRDELATRYNEASSLKEIVMDVKNRLGKTDGNYQSDVTLALLQTATAEAEEATELLVEDFLGKNTTIEEFLQTYLKQRTHVHILRTKVDKMSALLLKSDGRGILPERPRRLKKAPPPPAPAKPSATQLPYPVFPNFPTPPTFANSQRNVPIVPARLAPLPPVQVPRRVSNPSHPGAMISTNPMMGGQPHLTSNMPYGPSPGAYPQYVKLPN